MWWARQESNLQGFPHVVLSHARLPFRHSPEASRARIGQPLFTTETGEAKPNLRWESGRRHFTLGVAASGLEEQNYDQELPKGLNCPRLRGQGYFPLCLLGHCP
jgi:hypothetical protein